MYSIDPRLLGLERAKPFNCRRLGKARSFLAHNSKNAGFQVYRGPWGGRKPPTKTRIKRLHGSFSEVTKQDLRDIKAKYQSLTHHQEDVKRLYDIPYYWP